MLNLDDLSRTACEEYIVPCPQPLDAIFIHESGCWHREPLIAWLCCRAYLPGTGHELGQRRSKPSVSAWIKTGLSAGDGVCETEQCEDAPDFAFYCAHDAADSEIEQDVREWVGGMVVLPGADLLAAQAAALGGGHDD